MGRKKTVKNKEVTDVQRDRILRKRVLEERASAAEIWKWKESRGSKERIAHYLQGKTLQDHIDMRILKCVAFGLKYGASYYPKTPDEKYWDRLGSDHTNHIIKRLRLDPDYKWLSIATEILHENQHTGDLEYPIFDFKTSQNPRNKKNLALLEWLGNRSEVDETRKDITDETVRRAGLSEKERQRLQREHDKKREDRKNNNNESKDKEGDDKE